MLWASLVLVRFYSFSYLSKKTTHLYLSAGRDVPLAATRIYEMSFFTGFGVSSLIYFLLNVAFPVPGKHSKFEEVDLSAGEKHDGSAVNDDDDDDADSKKSNSAVVYPVWWLDRDW